MVTLQLRQIDVPPGQRIMFHDVPWLEFEAILEELGNHRTARIAYIRETLEIIVPLPEHEDDKEIIGDLVKALLEELDLEFRSVDSTTFKHQAMLTGIEPDQCFYIQNEQLLRGKKRLDLALDPPPDLVLEVDVTPRTHLDIYKALNVPEVWRFEKDTLQINILQGDRYMITSESPTFPGLPITQLIPHYLERSRTEGRTAVIRELRRWVNDHQGA